jgi:hypothetical protein
MDVEFDEQRVETVPPFIGCGRRAGDHFAQPP